MLSSLLYRKIGPRARRDRRRTFLVCIRGGVHQRRDPRGGQGRPAEKGNNGIGQCGRGGETKTATGAQTATRGQFTLKGFGL